MIEKEVSPINESEVLSLVSMVQNMCLAQTRCTPKCPLKDPYCKCKFISRPTNLKGLNNFMYNKIADLYPLFRRIRSKCNFTACSKCTYYIRLNSGYYGVCSIRGAFQRIQSNINRNNGTAWR